MIKAVLFDMDGTLVDSEKHYTNGTYTWMNRLGNYTMEQIYPIIGKDMKNTYLYLQSISGLPVEELERRNTEYFTKEDPMDYTRYLFDDVKDVFDHLKKKGIRIALCSTSSKELIEQFLEESGLKEDVDLYVTGDDFARNKPYPDIYLYAMEKLHAGPDECVVMEDSKEGIASGKASGAYTVARDASRYHIDQSQADRVIKDLRELLEVTDE